MPKPVSIICYICGREFGTKSIGIHEPQCMKKWEVQNNQLPKSKQQPRPVRPVEFDVKFSTDPRLRQQQIEKLNQASNVAASENLISCKYCLRTFLPNRIEKHESICQGIKSRSVLKSAVKPKTGPEVVINEPEIKPTLRKPNAKSPTKEPIQPTQVKNSRSMSPSKKTDTITPDSPKFSTPQKPISIPDNKTFIGKYSQNEANAPSFSHDFVMGVDPDQLVQCKDCEKMILRSVIGTHQEKFCNSSAGRDTSNLSESGGKFVKGKFVECINCGKSFSVSSLVIHQRECLNNCSEEMPLN